MQGFWRPWQARTGVTICLAVTIAAGVFGLTQDQPAAEAGKSQITRAVGTIKSVQVDSLTLTLDAGGEVPVALAKSTKILRVSPGQTDLKEATPIQVQDLQTGDRVLVRGQSAAGGHSMMALAVIVMKQADVSAKQERDREDWQRRGVGGLVSAVDTAGGTITIASGSFGASRQIVIHAVGTTIARRYAADSVKFESASPAPFDQIKPGDQLRARGTRSADGNNLTAEEIVSGTFRNIAGTITAIDLATNSLTVQDAIGKSAVVVKVSPDSQVKKLPAEMAQRIAARLKASGGDQPVSAQEPKSSAGESGANSPRFARAGGAAGERGSGAPDFQRFLSRIPSSALSDLQKGDAVMVVSTMGEGSGAVTAITMLAGVEPILTAAPNRSAAMTLSPWTLGGSNAEAEAAP
jgi:hypothetical protein